MAEINLGRVKGDEVTKQSITNALGFPVKEIVIISQSEYNVLLPHEQEGERLFFIKDKLGKIFYKNELVWEIPWDGTFADPLVGQKLFDEGLIADPTQSTLEELAGITSIDSVFMASGITSFDELKYFTGVVSMGNDCFFNCSSLTSITLPESVTSLGAFCFSNCSSLTSITLPESVNSLGNRCFNNSTSLTSIDIPESVTSIGNDCFNGCSSLTLATVLPAIPPSLGEGVFDNVHSSFNIKVLYPYVDDYKTSWNAYASIISALENAQDGYWVHKDTGVKTYFGLEEPSIVGGTLKSPSWASDCSKVKLPWGVTGLDTYCFVECTYLTSIILPEGFTRLGDGCFGFCTSLTSIDIPESVTNIGNVCFMGCSSLTSIDIPESVTSLGESCFKDCTSLTLATVLPTVPPTLGTTAFDNVHESFNIKVHSPYVDDYKTATNWINYASIISALPDGYWVHKDTGVKTYFGLEEPSIEDGIMGYPSWMPNCSEVKLPSGVTGFKTYTWVMEEWGGFELPYNGFVHTKESYMAGNEVLTVVDLSNMSITSISPECFISCKALTSVTLPESVISLENTCFMGCTSLTSITIPESVTSIGNDCFKDCTSLTSISIPESVSSLGISCFMGCSSLTSIDIPESVTSIGNDCFVHCASLTSINIPAGVTSIKSSCFNGCTSLTSINIPEGVTSLGNYCFNGCTSLTLATVLPAVPPSLGTFVFTGVHTSFNIKVNSPYVDDYKTNWNTYASIISAI